MAIDIDFAEQNIITIQDNEESFFDDFTKKNGIPWSIEERNNKRKRYRKWHLKREIEFN